jgi:hypothetical protein
MVQISKPKSHQGAPIFTHPLHHPANATLFPAKRAQEPIESPVFVLDGNPVPTPQLRRRAGTTASLASPLRIPGQMKPLTWYLKKCRAGPTGSITGWSTARNVRTSGNSCSGGEAAIGWFHNRSDDSQPPAYAPTPIRAYRTQRQIHCRHHAGYGDCSHIWSRHRGSDHRVACKSPPRRFLRSRGLSIRAISSLRSGRYEIEDGSACGNPL